MPQKKGLLERLNDGEDVLVAEGFLFEVERRGYMAAGSFVPEVVVEHPEALEQLHREFVHAGSDVVLAFTYYGHREKVKLIDREDDLEKINRDALRIAKKVADDNGVLMAGNICNTTLFDAGKPETFEPVEQMFKEQIEWAVEEGADFIVAETYFDFAEAELALESIKKYGQGLPAVVTLQQTPSLETRDGVAYDVGCKKLEDAGAAVVGLNCGSGPHRMIELMKAVRSACKGPIAALPVPYEQGKAETFFQYTDHDDGNMSFPLQLDQHYCPRKDMRWFGEQCKEIGIQYAGICCGNSSRHFREFAEGMGRHPAASRYAPQMNKHFIYGDNVRDAGKHLREQIYSRK